MGIIGHPRVPFVGLAVGTAWLAVLILLFNDHYLKFASPSWLTGKLSDVAELFVLPMVVSGVVVTFLARMPSVRCWAPLTVYLSTGALFIAIKVDQHTADAFRVALIPLTGGGTASVADPTDLLALPVLLLSYAIFRRAPALVTSHRWRIAVYPLVALTVFASVANSPGVPPNVQLLADPNQPGRLYALFVDEDYYGGTYPRGIYRTDDAGRSWRRVGVGGQRFAIDSASPTGLFVLNGDTVTSVPTDAVITSTSTPSPSPPQLLNGTRRLFVVTSWPQHDMFIISENSLVRSRDRGTSWVALRSGQSLQDLAPSSIDGLLYAVVDQRTLRSADHGATWEDVGQFPVSGQVRLGVDPGDAARLIAATEKGMYLSVDNARTWAQTWHFKTASGRDARPSVVFDPDHPERVYATLGTDIGLLVSGDRGQQWRQSALPALTVAVAREGAARVFIQADYRGVFHESKLWPDLEPWTKVSAGLPFR